MDGKLTVLYISNQGGGAPKSLLNMIKSLREWVYPIVLFENDWYDYQAFVNEGFECHIVPFRMGMVLDTPEYKKMKWRLHRYFDEYYLNKRVAARVAKLFSGRKIDIVHTNTGAITFGNDVAKALGAKSVWHLREFQDIDFGGHPYEGWTAFYRKLRDADTVIGITHAVGKHFHFESLRNAHVVWDAVRSGKDAVTVLDKDNYILYCSSKIVPAKGLHDMIEAFAHSYLPAKGINMKVIGIMDEDYSSQITRLINKYGLKDHIQFLGNQGNVKPYFEKALAFVLPSFNEGLGRVVIEAMFYGCPVIVRKEGGPTEYIEDEKNGYFFNNVDDLVNKMDVVCSKNQEDLIHRAQKFAIENFSEEVYGEKIMAVYKGMFGYGK